MTDQHHGPAVGREGDTQGPGRGQPIELVGAGRKLIAGTQVPDQPIPEGDPAGALEQIHRRQQS